MTGLAQPHWLKIANFPHPLSFSALTQREPFWIYGKALLILKLESSRQPKVKIWWSAPFLTDPLVQQMNRQTNRIVMAKTCYSSSCCCMWKHSTNWPHCAVLKIKFLTKTEHKETLFSKPDITSPKFFIEIFSPLFEWSRKQTNSTG